MPPLSTRMLRKLIRGVDAWLRRGIGIVEFEQGEDALVRIGTGRAERAMELSDGTRLQPGDLLLELHFWNEHLMTLPSAGPTLRWAVSTRRQVTRSLHRLAAYLQRTPDLPEVPTTAEAGLPDLVLYGYNAILAASATPRPIIDKINAAVNAVLADPDTIARGRTLGLRIGGGPPEELKQIMDKVTEIYAKVVKSANIKPE